MLRWLRSVWAWMTWEPTWPRPEPKTPVWQPLTSCTTVIWEPGTERTPTRR